MSDLPLHRPKSHPHKRRATLFDSPFLESFTFISVRAFIVLWAVVSPIVLFVTVRTAPTLWAPLLILGGIAVWTLTEYALHRFLFHFEARSAGLKRMIYIIHGNHHAFPNDPLRNLMPPIVSLPVGALVWTLCVATMGPVGSWCFFGFMLGYVGYDLIHYACHQFPINGKLARTLKVHHMRHHRKRVEGNYAITTIMWDRLLSTRISAGREGA